MKHFLLFFSLFSLIDLFGQSNWQAFTDSIQTLSSPRSCYWNNEGIKDMVIGGGLEGFYSPNRIMAFDGINGSLLWKHSSRNEVFGSAIFMDITNDGINDVFINGRQAQLLALNGATGQLIWDYFPYGTNPADSGLYNFYNPQFIPDVDGDQLPDLLVSNGGDHLAPEWQTDRPPGHLMVVNALNGGLLAKAVVPDSAETYCSPVVADIYHDGTLWMLYGTGGENLGGSFYACPLNDLIQNESLSNSVQLATDPNKGFIAPASIYRNDQGTFAIYIQSFGGKITKIEGPNFAPQWTYLKPGTESSAALVLGRFTADTEPDVFAILFKGIAPSYSDFYQVLLNGADGSVEYLDSLGTLNYASANAVDLDNNGLDEAVVSLTYSENNVYKHRIQRLDFTAINQIDVTRSGVNLGSTPLFDDLDNDNQIEMVYVVKRDSLNPVGNKGIYVNAVHLGNVVPNAGIAWGSYMGNDRDGIYEYEASPCGFGSVISSANAVNPLCNGDSTGYIQIQPIGGTGPYTYLWSDGSTGSTLNNLPAGNYSVQVTDANGCYEDRSFTLNDPYLITFGGIAPPTCPSGANGAAILNSSGCYCMFSGCTFLWENGGTAKPNYDLTEGWNSVAITHADGCVVVDSVFVPYALPVIDTALITNLLCYNDNSGSIKAIPTMPLDSVQFYWSNGASTSLIENLYASDYGLIAVDTRGCSDTLTYTVTQPDSLFYSYSSSPIVCNGDQNGEIVLSATGGVAPYVYLMNGIANASNLMGPLGPGSYEITVVDTNGCTSELETVTLNDPSSLVLSLTGTPSQGMTSFDGTATATVSGGVAPYAIQWDDVNGQTGDLAVYLNPGWITATVLDANGCGIIDSIYIGALGLNDEITSYVQLYPNPATTALYLKATEQLLGKECIVRDAMGRRVDQLTIGATSEVIAISELEKGIYFIEIQGLAEKFQFVKQ